MSKTYTKDFKMEDTKTMELQWSHPSSLPRMDKVYPLNPPCIYMIGSLHYLTFSKLDIIFSVSFCAIFQYYPKESYLSIVKWILRCLKETIDLGFCHPKCDKFDLITILNANFASYKVDKKISGGACHFLGHFLASWHGKKKILVKLSTVEVEYIVVVLYCTQNF